MGDAIKFVQTATISSGGTYQIVYTHDPKGKASRVGLISAYIASGTQTGDVSIKYGNDILLTELARRVRNEEKSMQQYILDGQLDAAFLRARTMQRTLDGLMERLNDLKYRE